MDLKEYVKQVLAQTDAEQVTFDLVVAPKDQSVEVVPSLDAANASRVQFTINQSPNRTKDYRK